MRSGSPTATTAARRNATQCVQGTIESVTQSETVSSAAETVAPAADAVKRRAAQVAEGLGVGVPALSS